jgi:hypothetical protein
MPVAVEHETFPNGLMVFAAIGPRFKFKLVVIMRSATGEKYREVLQQSAVFEQADAQFGARQWFFMQDGAPAHTSDENMQWPCERCNVLPFWPPNSPEIRGTIVVDISNPCCEPRRP